MTQTASGTRLDGGKVLRAKPNLAWQEVAGEVVILDVDGMVLRGLNRSGGRAWRLIDGRRSLGEVAACLADAYGLAHDTALADVIAFASDLERRGLLEVVS